MYEAATPSVIAPAGSRDSIIIVLAIQRNGKCKSEVLRKMRKSATFREICNELVDPHRTADSITCTITARAPGYGDGVLLEDMEAFTLEECISDTGDRVLYQVNTAPQEDPEPVSRVHSIFETGRSSGTRKFPDVKYTPTTLGMWRIGSVILLARLHTPWFKPGSK